MLHYKHLNNGTMNPTFTLCEKGALSGIHLLDPTITINSITVAPSLLYFGGDATASNWAPRGGYGETLAIQAGTAPTLNQGSPLLGPYDDSVLFNTGGYYRASNTATGDIATEDIVFELVFKPIAGLVICSHRNLAANGWIAYMSGTALYFIIDDGTDQVSFTYTGMTLDAWYHAIVFIDRSGSGVWYLNGVQGTAQIATTVAETITVANTLCIGSRQGAEHFNGNVAYAAMWKYEAWLDTHLQATIAQERFFKLTGLYPQVAKGTALPITATRNTAAYLPKTETNGDTHLYRVGASWLRVGNPVDTNGEQLVGYLAEPPATNKILWSENFNHEGSWTQQDTGDTWGAQLCADGDMEQADTSFWVASNNATLTKETTDPHGGSRCLRVTYGGTNNAYAQKVLLTVGHTYTLSGWFRGDGTNGPIVYLGVASGYAVSGAITNVWQAFSITRKVVATSIALSTTSTSAGQYCEFDDLKLVEITETAPNQILNAFPLISDSTNLYHGVYQSVVLTAVKNTFSVYAKAGNKNWLYLTLEGDPYAAYYDLANGVVGTVTAANDETGAIEDCGGGWYRCSLTGTLIADTYTCGIYSANADNDLDFAGDGTTVNTYLWGAQLEALNFATSYVPTTTAAATRNADILTFKADDGNIGGVGSELAGTIKYKFLLPGITPPENGVYFRLTDGGGVTDYIQMHSTTSSRFQFISAATAGSAGGGTFSTNTYDGYVHSTSIHWATNSAYITLDGVASAVDTVVTIPDDLDQLHIGHGNTISQIKGLLSEIKIYKKKL